jgi:type VI secretion system protein ImpA
VTDLTYSGVSRLFEGDAPAGVDLRKDETLIAIYRAIKDARSSARAEDRSRENVYVSDGDDKKPNETVLQPSDKWRDVHDLCVEALSTRSKDIELLSWLTEATLRVNGLLGLHEALKAIRLLFIGNLDSLYPSQDEDPADRLSSLAGLNGSQDSDGTLLRPLRLTSLAPDQIYGRLNLWELEQAKRSKDSQLHVSFQEYFSTVNGTNFVKVRDAVVSSLSDIDDVDRHLTDVYGASAPSFRRIKDVLEQISKAYVELSVNVAMPALPEKVPLANEQVARPDATSASALTIDVIHDREQAFQSLMQIAAFFRRTEPHSSIPFALETVVRRGRMDFMGLLMDLLPDENQRKDVLIRAGIELKALKDIV